MSQAENPAASSISNANSSTSIGYCRGDTSTPEYEPPPANISGESLKDPTQGSMTESNHVVDGRYIKKQETHTSDSRTIHDDNKSDPFDPLAEFVGYYPSGYDIESAADVESIGRYGPGGFCPISLGDHIGLDGRYRIAHKLGHGQFSIVWLCFDEEEGKWRAIKILDADSSDPACPELAAMRLLRDTSQESLFHNHIGLPLDHFWMESANGRHLCFVLRLLGPRVGSENNATFDYENQLQRFYYKNHDVYVDAAFQVVCGLNFLHEKGLCHGDLRPANILMQYEGVDEMSEKELLDLLREPETWPVEFRSGKKPAGFPLHLVVPVDLGMLTRFMVPKIAIVDFGLSYQHALGSPKHGLPGDFSAPEILLEGPQNTKGKPTDIWALACTITAIFTDGSPFEYWILDALSSMELELGPLPEPYRSYWKENWERIMSRWGAPSTSKDNICRYWEQEPAPGESLAPLTVSRELYIEVRQRHISEFGTADNFPRLFSFERRWRYSDLQSREKQGGRSLADAQGESSCASSEYSPSDYGRINNKILIPGEKAATQTYQRDTSDNQGKGIIHWDQIPQLFPNAPAALPDDAQNARYAEIVRRTIATVYGHQQDQGLVQTTANEPAKTETALNPSSPLKIENPIKPHEGGTDRIPRGMRNGDILAPGEYYRTWRDAQGNVCEAFRIREEDVSKVSDLIRKMLRYDPDERIDTAAALNHDLFKKQRREMREITLDRDQAQAQQENGEAKKRGARNRDQPGETNDDEADNPQKKLRRSARLSKREISRRTLDYT